MEEFVQDFFYLQTNGCVCGLKKGLRVCPSVDNDRASTVYRYSVCTYVGTQFLVR